MLDTHTPSHPSTPIQPTQYPASHSTTPLTAISSFPPPSINQKSFPFPSTSHSIANSKIQMSKQQKSRVRKRRVISVIISMCSTVVVKKNCPTQTKKWGGGQASSKHIHCLQRSRRERNPSLISKTSSKSAVPVRLSINPPVLAGA